MGGFADELARLLLQEHSAGTRFHPSGPETGGRDIERALAMLVEDQRVALLLVVLEGLSYREVAEVQGVPIGTVMSRLARARAQIRAYLEGERPPLRRVK